MKDLGLLAAHAAAAPTPRGAERPWWESRLFVAAMVLVALVPFLGVGVPPLVDLPGHMARYRVAMDGPEMALLGQWFSFRWALVGNLGVDLLAVPLGKLIGLELATQLVVTAIPAITVGGFLWVAREVHNRLPPTAMFALPFAAGHPYLFGFVNFALAMGLAFVALGLWLRLETMHRLWLRALLFVPISFALFLCHTFGWGVLGLLAFSAEAVRQHDRGIGWWRSAWASAVHALPLAGPMLLILLWRSEATGGATVGWFHWHAKWLWVKMALRDRWEMADQLVLLAPAAVLVAAIAHPRLTLSRNLAFSLMVLVACFLLLPKTIFGSAYADMRMAPYLFAVAMLAIRFRGRTDAQLARVLAAGGLAFVLVTTGIRTASMVEARRQWNHRLEALDRVPEGSRVAALVGSGCVRWALPRQSHLPSFALFRRSSFVNDQFALPGAALLQVHYPQARPFELDPSQMVLRANCRSRSLRTAEQAIARMPAGAFDYLWLIDLPPTAAEGAAGWTPRWQGEGASLFSWGGATAPPATPRTAG